MLRFRTPNRQRILGASTGAAPPSPAAEPEERPAPPVADPSFSPPIEPGPQPQHRPASAAPVAPEVERVMRVAFDVRFWQMSGLGTFSRELLAAFARMEAPIAWTMIGPPEVREQLPPGLEIEQWLPFDAPPYAVGGSLRYPHPRGAELLHYPHYNLPLAGMRRSVVSVFDLFHLKYGTLAKRTYQRLLLRRLRWSRALLAPAADSVARELTLLGRLPAERIRVIPLGPGRGYENPDYDVQAREPVLSLAGQPLRGPWLLATGIDQPHKNFDFLLTAMSLYFQRRPDAPPLVWVGLDAEDVKRRLRQLPAHARMRIACEPFSSGARIESLLAGAVALVFPSLDEGFGFPPLEAMRRGVPVVCAQREPMTSLYGNAPLYFEPTESASLWRMLDRLNDNPQMREEIRQRGLRQVARYSWEATAFAYWKVYREAAGWRPAVVPGEG